MFRGLKFESDPGTVFRSYGASVGIDKKGAFFKGLISIMERGIIVTNPGNKLMNRIIKRIFKIKGGGANEYLCG